MTKLERASCKYVYNNVQYVTKCATLIRVMAIQTLYWSWPNTLLAQPRSMLYSGNHVVSTRQRHSRLLATMSQPEQLSYLRHSVLWIFDTMPDSPRIFKDLIVVSTLERLVSEEMDSGILYAPRQVLLVFNVL